MSENREWEHRIINKTNVPEIQASSIIKIFAGIDADGNPSFDEIPFRCERSYAVWDGQRRIDLLTPFGQIVDFWNDELKRLKLKPVLASQVEPRRNSTVYRS